jgi:pimeloyl-ACP methyl ester carboxylesterase
MRGAAVLLSLLCACNVVRMRERGLRTRTARAGLVESRVAVGSDRVHVWRGGTGSPVLLLHGFGASAIWQWQEQLPDFVARHDVVMPDLLGFGGSSTPGSDASMQHQSRAMIALLDELELERVDLVGISYGGLLAYTIAGAHPDRVGRLVLVDSPGHAWSQAQHRELLRRFDAESSTALFVPTSPDGIRTLMAIASARPPRVPDWAARQAIAALYDPHRADQTALLAHLEGDIDRLASQIARPKAQTLLIWGEHDPVFPLHVGRRLADDLDAELVVLGGARHMPNADDPTAFNRAVLRFLARTPK